MSNGESIAATVTPLRGSDAATVAWRSRGELYLTVIAKASFSFVADAPASRAPPQPVVRAEVHHGRDPRRSVELTSDLAPYLPRADVLFTGFAHAPGGAPARSLPVRLAILAGQRPILDRRLLVTHPSGFTRMHLVYEKAPRGPGAENPFGLAPGEEEPNVVDPERPGHPAGFGPIGRAWPTRKRLLGATPRRALDAEVADIPEGFDWAYFNAAPPDQQTGYLRGDEEIVLEGLHPSISPLRTRLPGARGRARIHGLAAFGVAEGAPLELVADTLRIDGEAQLCTIVFRQHFALPSGPALASARVVAGVEIDGERAHWPLPAAFVPVPAGLSVTSHLPALDDVTHEADVARRGAVRPALPFVPPGAPPACAAPSPRAGEGAQPFTGTLALPPEGEARPARAAPPGLRAASDAAAGVLPPTEAAPPDLRAASDAAAGVLPPTGGEPASTPPARATAPRAPANAPRAPASAAPAAEGPRRALDLLWFDPRSLPRIRRHGAWRDILRGLDDQPLDPEVDEADRDVDPAGAEERREVFEVLAKGEPAGEEALRGALRGAVRPDGRFAAPIALIEGEMAFPFDEIAKLEAVVAVVGPLAGSDERLNTALAAARAYLSTQGPMSPRPAAEGHGAAILAAYGQGKRAVPLAEVEAQVDQALLDLRRYQRRALLGGKMLRALLLPPRASEAVPAYCPEAIADVLPMFHTLRVRVLAEIHAPADPRDRHAMALRVAALARVVEPSSW